jgi:hypothetical protein
MPPRPVDVNGKEAHMVTEPQLPDDIGPSTLDNLMRPDAFGVSMSYWRLRERGFVSTQCRRLVRAAIIASRKITSAQAPAMLGDHPHVIGEPGSSVAKGGRPVNVRIRLRDLVMASPVPLVLRHIEPGFGALRRPGARSWTRRLYGDLVRLDAEVHGKVVDYCHAAIGLLDACI